MEFYSIDGILAGQHPGIEEIFNKIIPNFDRIIEIGTHKGGLTLYLHKNKSNDCDLISYDIEASYNEVPKDYNIDFRIGDCFSKETGEEIGKLIKEPSKRVLLLCDGGHKLREFSAFSEYLKCNDVIMLHDYGDTYQSWLTYATNVGWENNYSGESYARISTSVMINNLEKYKYEEFASIFWGSFIKK